MFCGVTPPTLRVLDADRLSGGQDSKTPSLLDDIVVTAGLPFLWNGTRAFRPTCPHGLSSRSQGVLVGPSYYIKLSRDPTGFRRVGQRIQFPSAPWCLTTPSSALQWSALPTLASSLGGGSYTRSDGTGFPVSHTSCHAPPLARFDVAQSYLVTTRNEVEAGNYTPRRLVACRASSITSTRLPQSLPIGIGRRAIRLCVSITSGLAAPDALRGRGGNP